MTIQASKTYVSGRKNQDWMNLLGWSFNPFQFAYLESSNDSHIGDYLVGEEFLEVIRRDVNDIVYAPRGGGKTAMRIGITRDCFMSYGGSPHLPVPYLLPEHTDEGKAVSIDRHLEWMIQAGVQALMVSLVYRPDHFFCLSKPEKVEIVCGLNDLLRRKYSKDILPVYIGLLSECKQAEDIFPALKWPHVITNPTSEARLHQLGKELSLSWRQVIASSDRTMDVTTSLRYLIHLIVDLMRFRSVFLLVDAVDAFDETNRDASRAAQMVQPVFDSLTDFNRMKIYIKCFLPSEAAGLISRQQEKTIALNDFAITWSPERLVEMACKRVEIASRGKMHSLGAISSADLRNPEEYLANSLSEPLPREMLILLDTVMNVYNGHQAKNRGMLMPEDIVEALHQYHSINQRSKQV